MNAYNEPIQITRGKLREMLRKALQKGIDLGEIIGERKAIVSQERLSMQERGYREVEAMADNVEAVTTP